MPVPHGAVAPVPDGERPVAHGAVMAVPSEPEPVALPAQVKPPLKLVWGNGVNVPTEGIFVGAVMVVEPVKVVFFALQT